MTYLRWASQESADLDWVFYPPPGNGGQTWAHPSPMDGRGAGEQAQTDRLSFKPLLASCLLTSHGAKHTTWLSSIQRGANTFHPSMGGAVKSHNKGCAYREGWRIEAIHAFYLSCRILSIVMQWWPPSTLPGKLYKRSQKRKTSWPHEKAWLT